MKHFYRLTIMFLACVVLCLISDLQDAYRHTRIETQVDSVIVKTHDTIYIDKPKMLTRHILDTVLMQVADTLIPVPVEQKVYGDSTYTAWVSGVNPSLDSLYFLQNNTTVYRTELRTVKVPDLKSKVYVGVGVDMLGHTPIPKAGVALQKNKVLLGANVGVYDKKILYGLDVKLKIK